MKLKIAFIFFSMVLASLFLPKQIAAQADCGDSCGSDPSYCSTSSIPDLICTSCGGGTCEGGSICSSPTVCSLCEGASGYVGTCLDKSICSGLKRTDDGSGTPACTGGSVCCTTAPTDDYCILSTPNPWFVFGTQQIFLETSTPDTSYTIKSSDPRCLFVSPALTDPIYGIATINGDCSPPQTAPGETITITATAGPVSCTLTKELHDINEGGPCVGDSTGNEGFCRAAALGCGFPLSWDGQGGCPSDYICCVFSDCIGSQTNQPGTCSFVTCPDNYIWDGINPLYSDISCGLLESCCVSKLSYPIQIKTPITPQCPGGPTASILTALGCFIISATGNTPLLNNLVTGPNPNISPFDATGLAVFFLRFAIGVGGGTAMLLIIISGFMFATSAGDPGKKRNAREYFVGAISGLLLIIFSVFLLELIGVKIFNLPGLVPGT